MHPGMVGANVIEPQCNSLLTVESTKAESLPNPAQTTGAVLISESIYHAEVPCMALLLNEAVRGSAWEDLCVVALAAGSLINQRSPPILLTTNALLTLYYKILVRIGASTLVLSWAVIGDEGWLLSRDGIDYPNWGPLLQSRVWTPACAP